MSSRKAAVVVAFVTVPVFAGCAGGDERAIRNQMAAIEEALTVPANDGELGRVTRLAALRKLLAPDVRLSLGGMQSGTQASEIVGRDAALGLTSRWIPPAGGVSVEFVDVQMMLEEDGATAQVYCTARAASGPDDRPVVDARELTVSFSRIDGEWLVTAVRPEETLMR